MNEVNYLAVLLAGIGNMVVGSVWYGPLFGKTWMEGMGLSNAELKARMGSSSMGGLYLQQFILALLMAFVFSHVLVAFHAYDKSVEGVMAGLQGAFWMWLGFIFPVIYGRSLWTGRKLQYVALDLGYWIITLASMGIILSLWK